MGKSDLILILLIYKKKTKLAAMNITKLLIVSLFAKYRGNYNFPHSSIIEKALNFTFYG